MADIDGKSVFQSLSTILKGIQAFNLVEGYKYIVQYGPRSSCAVNVIDSTVKGYNNSWVFRIDGPHATHHSYNHLNINKAFSGLKDPHIYLPPGSLTVAENTTKFCQLISQFAFTMAVLIDVVDTGRAIANDSLNGTSQETVATVVPKMGAWIGGYGGASLGAKMGTLIFPGVGTIVFGTVGGVGGAMWGRYNGVHAASKLNSKL